MLTSFTKVDLGPEGLGFTLEQRLTNRIAVDLSSGIGGGYDIGEGHFAYILNIYHPAFYFSATPKFYYKRNQSVEEAKQYNYNSGNYIGARIKYTTAGIASKDRMRNSMLVNLHWGMQRVAGLRWTINTHIGAGYAQDLNYKFGTVYPSAEIKFSYILSSGRIDK